MADNTVHHSNSNQGQATIPGVRVDRLVLEQRKGFRLSWLHTADSVPPQPHSQPESGSEN